MQPLSEGLLPGPTTRKRPVAHLVVLFAVLGVCSLVAYLGVGRIPDQEQISKPVDLISLGDAKCYRFTGGTCTIMACKKEREAKCGGSIFQKKCYCPKGTCVDTNGNCAKSVASELVVSGLTIRSAGNKLVVNHRPGESVGIGPLKADVPHKWDIYRVRGFSDKGHHHYYVTAEGDPTSFLGLSTDWSAHQKQLGTNCMQMKTPGVDPEQITAEICRTEAGNAISFYYGIMKATAKDEFSCVAALPKEFDFGEKSAWMVEPMTPEVQEWMQGLQECAAL